MDLCKIACCAYFVLAVVCSAMDLDDDLAQLSEMLPGYYGYNSKQSRHVQQVVKRPLSPHETPVEALTTISLRATYLPVEVSFIKDAFNVYVEQTLHGKTRPHRRWLYSFSKDERSRSIKQKVYHFKDSSLAEKISKNPRALKYLSESDVTTRSNCDMDWRRMGERFLGTTSRQCVAVVDGKQVGNRYVITHCLIRRLDRFKHNRHVKVFIDVDFSSQLVVKVNRSTTLELKQH